VRGRRPLALLGAVCVAAAALLVVAAHPARPATRSLVVPLGVAPTCGAGSSTAGTSVQLTAANLIPGTSPVTIGTPDGANGPGTTAGSVVVAADGTLNQTLALPPLAAAGVYQVTVRNGALRSAVGYFSVPCPTLSVQPTCGPADDGSGAHYALTLSGTGYGPSPPTTAAPSTTATTPTGASALPVHIQLDGTEVPGSPAQVAADGTISVLVTPAYVPAGSHTLRAFQTTADEQQPLVPVELREAKTTFTTPCATTTQTQTQTATQTTTATATTATVATTGTATATTPVTPATLTIAPTCLDTAASGTKRVALTGSGFAAGALQVLVDGTVATNATASGAGAFSAEVEIAAGHANHLIEARQGSQGATATLRVPCAAHPSLTLSPALGPPGFVTQASGSGFPPNVRVHLSWTVGLGSSVVRTDAHGAFRTAVLIFPQDETGPRALLAAPVGTKRFTGVQAAFLCVPGSEQPPAFAVRR
jgi:hypothetical protein